MKLMPNEFRIRKGIMGTTEADGNNGMFRIPQGLKHHYYIIKVTDGEGWEHVSIHVSNEAAGAQRTPYWSEMCVIKDIFWHEDEVVVQYHPKKEDYVNLHPNVLHLWRPTNLELPTPPKVFV